jgi:hypothetical protein
VTGGPEPAGEPSPEAGDPIPAAIAVDQNEEWMPSSVPAKADDTAASAGPRAAFDGSWTWGAASLTPDQVRVAEDAYDRFRAAEGRNLFGSYGGVGLTTVLRGIEANLEFGRLAPDTEQNCLLDPDTFKARFADLLGRYPDRTAERLARRVPGAISYSFIFDSEHYSAGIWIVQEALAGRGFQLLARRNDWNSAANRCVSEMWHDASSDLPFGVQFHTTASLEAQKLARTSAALISDPRIPAAETANLESDLAAAWAAVPAPPGNGEIGDYRRGGTVPSVASSSAGRLRSGLPPDRSTPLSAGAGDRSPAGSAGPEHPRRWPPRSGTGP